tara:strand:- start:553 stop:1224 length:672 start_codon:yes stop_codon:yes gene_type:complete
VTPEQDEHFTGGFPFAMIVPLYNRERQVVASTVIADEDAWIGKWKWGQLKYKDSRYRYAARWERRGEKWTAILMHRELLTLPTDTFATTLQEASNERRHLEARHGNGYLHHCLVCEQWWADRNEAPEACRTCRSRRWAEGVPESLSGTSEYATERLLDHFEVLQSRFDLLQAFFWEMTRSTNRTLGDFAFLLPHEAQGILREHSEGPFGKSQQKGIGFGPPKA